MTIIETCHQEAKFRICDYNAKAICLKAIFIALILLSNMWGETALFCRATSSTWLSEHLRTRMDHPRMAEP